MSGSKLRVRLAGFFVWFSVLYLFVPNTPLYSASSRTFHVAMNGANSNTGTLAKPFRTIQKCALVAEAGDTCTIRGGVYRETVTPANSGTADAPITFAPYMDEVVTVNGADRVTGWSVYRGSIYRARVNWDLGEGANQVFVDRQMMVEARFPNTSLDPLRPTLGKIEDGGNDDERAFLRDAKLTQPAGFWQGARLWILPTARWVAQTGTVFESKPGWLSFSFASADDLFSVRAGDPYYLTGTFAALDSPGEWFLDAPARTLYLWAPDGTSPNKQNVWVKRRQVGFDLNGRAHIRVVNLDFFATTITSDRTSHHLLLDGLDARYISHFSALGPDMWDLHSADSGISLRGHDNVLQNSNLAWSAGNGVVLNGKNQKVFNNVIRDVSYAGTDAGAVNTGEGAIESTGHEIAYNTLYNSGRGLIIHRNLTAGKILNNHLFNFGLLTTDVGATYCWSRDGKGTVIAYNWIHHGKATDGYGSVGIYLDAASANFLVHHNVIWNVTHALNINSPSRGQQIYNNTLSGSQSSIWSGDGDDMTGTVVKNNILVRIVQLPGDVLQSNNLKLDHDPEFADAEANNFNLKLTLPVKDKGATIPPYTLGFRGLAPDIGAYEVGGELWRAGVTRQAAAE